MLQVMFGISINEFAIPLSIQLVNEEEYKSFGITVLFFNITFVLKED